MKREIEGLVEKSIEELKKQGKLPEFEIPEIFVEIPENTEYGDYATNIALKIGKIIKQNPQLVAELIALQTRSVMACDIVEATGGFINFKLKQEYWQKQMAEILEQKTGFGKIDVGKGVKAQVEFISANPTGPLTLGNGRGGFCGDVLANVLAWAGYKAEREYYVNDRGEQIRALGHSVIGDDKAVYKGEYIEGLRNKIKPKQEDDPEKIGEKAGKEILEKMIQPTVKRMGIKFDKWFSEKDLYQKNEVQKILDWLKTKNLAYEKEGALWFCSTQFGDDKDRVLIKIDKETTYLASDIAYLKNKKDRGFEKLIYFWGADHYGYVERLLAAASVLGYQKEDVSFVVMQLVRLFKDGKEVRMSKREGVYVTLDELMNEVLAVNPLGLDAIRYFFLSRGPNSHLNFDLDLAKEQSEKNPIYYIQYAYARICSIFEKSKSQNSNFKSLPNLNLLSHKAELRLIKQLARLPEVVEKISQDFQVQRLPQYATDIAAAFHYFYSECRVIDESNQELTQARLSLVAGAKIVLKNVLDIMGISAPEKM